MRELMLILLFFACAGIMDLFVKLVDHFIVHTIIPESGLEQTGAAAEESPAAAERSGAKRRIFGTGKPEFGKGISAWAFCEMLLDKLSGKSKVMHSSKGYTVQIGTAHQTQVRIRHYE